MRVERVRDSDFTMKQGKHPESSRRGIAIAEKDNVPAILGLKDVSDMHDFRVDSKRKMFYLDFWK